MAEERARYETHEDLPGVMTPSSALEETLEQHLGVRPGEAEIGHEGLQEGHEPSEHSYWPILVAAAILVIGVGFLSHYLVSAVGAVLLLAALIGWFAEPWVS